jgi:hypothetical protein
MKHSILWMVGIGLWAVLGLVSCGGGGGDSGSVSAPNQQNGVTASATDVEDPAWILLVNK